MITPMFDNTNSPNPNPTSQFLDSPSLEMDSLQKDDFELLSAFLDGEVTASERQYIQQLLTTDAEMQRLYDRLLKLRQGFEGLPLPTDQPSAAELTQQVFNRVDRRRHLRLVTGIGGTIAAVAIGALSLVSSVSSPQAVPAIQLVQQPSPQPRSELLMIAVNRPVIEIPTSMMDPSPSPLKTD
jgi:anti-sigma factor RsiW